VEHHAAELSEHAVAYLNTDGNSRGFINIGGSHTLERLMGGVTADVIDPQTGVSVDARRRAMLILEGSNARIKNEAKNRAQLRISPLGSGSDYTPFLQHLGIASINIAFGGEAQDGSYHTLYDTYEHYLKFRDPGLYYGVALAQVAGRATLRIANAQRLPFEFAGLTDNIALYLSEIEALTDALRSGTEDTNSLIDAGTYDLALDPTKNLGAPSSNQPVPYFNFARLHNALTRLDAAATAYEGKVDQPASAEVNRLLYSSERLLTRGHGLAGRPWFKHHLYAPGFYTGYGVKTLPGVRESIEQLQFDAVDEQIVIAAQMIEELAARVEDLSR
jgi:N-acetylated-alpha-linked acidic dipeptidase